ncbi:hypothetical protein QYE76_029385 [Lolium multiflorum]|uniref:Transposase (putative) gypsy type domain-containing protein n=1 Tax=Lolium multiflorum TaxID=4521 RepID=A0AAD8QQC5_LOLMU|nr:hypothetical protein QYE76_029385 [Lolium multiflorum]
MAAEDLEWERSKISNQDTNMLKRLGLMKKEDAIRFPSEESYPKPPMEYRVSFVDHLIRGLSTPIHDFLRGLLFVYGIQLHQLTPNSILHISIFITLCECFLGIPPNWALWKRIFCLRRNGSHNVTYNIGGVVICVRTDVDYFDVKFPDSVQGWRKKWLYIHEESANSVEHNIVPFDGSAKIQRRRSGMPKLPRKRKRRQRRSCLVFASFKTLEAKSYLVFKSLPISLGLECGLFRLAKIPFGHILPMIKDLLIGSQFIGYRGYANRAEGAFTDAAAEEERVVEKVHQKVKRRRVGVDRINTKVTPIAEEMIEDLLRMDADFFADGHYADFLGAAPEENRVTLDDILNQD